MIAAVDWGNLTHAGAFIIGTIFGTVVTLRVLKIATGFVRRER